MGGPPSTPDSCYNALMHFVRSMHGCGLPHWLLLPLLLTTSGVADGKQDGGRDACRHCRKHEPVRKDRVVLGRVGQLEGGRLVEFALGVQGLHTEDSRCSTANHRGADWVD